MSEPSKASSTNRSIRWDMVGVVLFGCSAILWMALLTHDPADDLTAVFGTPVSSEHAAWYQPTAYPTNPKPHNACGWIGAILSQAMFQSFGCAAYLAALLVPLSGVVCLRQQPWASPLGRSLGWTLVFAAACSLPDRLGLHLPVSSPIGSGGYLGKLINLWLDHNLAHTGGTILVLCGLIIGLLLSTEYAILRFMGRAVAGSRSASQRVKLPTVPWFKRREMDPEMYASTRYGLPASVTMSTEAPTSDLGPSVPAAPSAGLNATSSSKPSLQGATAAAAATPAVESETTTGPAIRIGRRNTASVSTADLGGASKSLGRTDLINPKAKPLASAGLSAHSTASESDEQDADDDEWDEREDGHYLGDDQDNASDEEATEGEDWEYEEDGDADADGDVDEAEDESPAIAVPRAADKPPAPVAPPASTVRVKSGKSRGQVDPEQEKEHLYNTLNDTKLPAGSEEYVLPGLDLLIEGDDFSYDEQTEEVKRKARVLEQTFSNFGFNIRVVEIETGPVIAQYEIELEAGLRLSKITGLSDDLAIALRVPSVRIVAPIPGKNTVGIEVPNERRQVVRMREVIEEGAAQVRKMKIPLFLGKDVSGKPLSVDLASLPHLLIAGRTGTGKSVCLNSIICSILMARRPDEVRMLMIDPKMVELSGYGRLPHLMHPVVTDMRKAEAILAWAVDKMEDRYALLARAGVRHITSYNQLGRDELHDRLKPETPEEAELIPDHLPFIVIVADEMADLMMTAGKEVEAHIIRLAQKSRAVGIHLILATQKPTVDVITGLIKSNLPARISFQVASRTDSRVVLDENGADKLLGNGDMLFLWPGTSTLLRGQGTYLSDEEINKVVDHCSTGEQNFVQELVQLKVQQDEEPSAKPGALKKRDELYEAAVDIVVREGRGSCSLLQRALGIGYGRAARLIDYMAEDGIVGQYNGSQAREVVISLSDWDAMRGAAETPAPKTRSNKIRREDGWEETPKVRTPASTVAVSRNEDSQASHVASLVSNPPEDSEYDDGEDDASDEEEGLWDEK